METVTAEQAAEAAKGLNFDKVWAALMETRERMEATNQETQKRIDETNQETQKRIDETNQETQKRIEKTLSELSKNLGGLGNRLGELTEAMFTPDLWKKFNDLGYPFNNQSQNRKFTDGKRVIAEADVFLENGDFAMPVEIKTTLTAENVDDHIERIKRIRVYMDSHGDERKLVGAVAGAIVPESVRGYAHKHGLYVVEQSGESASIAEMPSSFAAMVW